MKRLYTIAILIICGMTAMAQNRPDMTHQSTGRDRGGVSVFFEVLQLQINEDGLLEVSGCGNDYYTVTITNESICVWSGIIGREYGNVINYSDFSLTATYTITITSSRGTTDVWKLENGVLIGFKMPNWGGITDHVTIERHPLQ